LARHTGVQIVNWPWLREDVRNGSLAAPGMGFGEGDCLVQPWSVEATDLLVQPARSHPTPGRATARVATL
jgi:hypothetical protein